MYSKRIKQSKRKANSFFFILGENNFARAKILLERKICRLSKNSPESTLAPGPFSPEQNHSHLGKGFLACAEILQRVHLL